MVIPTYLRTTYKHWEFHTKQQTNGGVQLDRDVISEVKEFAIERQKIWERKTRKQKFPFTTDTALQSYRFCNIYRELDSQTIQIHSTLKVLENSFEVWLLNVLFQRLICNPDTVGKVGLLSYDDKKNNIVYKKLKNLPRPKYGSAYIFPVSLIMKTNYPTREKFFCKYLPKVVKKCAEEIKSFQRQGVSEAIEQVLPIFGFNLKFHWTEVLIDVAYQFPDLIDLFKRFPIGPGSKPTMKMLSLSTNPEETCLALTRIEFDDFPYLKFNGKPVYLSAENWEGIGCEYRKYSNLKKGKGRRRLYNSIK